MLGILSASVIYLYFIKRIRQSAPIKETPDFSAHSGNVKLHNYSKLGKKRKAKLSLIPDTDIEDFIEKSTPRPKKESHNWSPSVLQHN